MSGTTLWVQPAAIAHNRAAGRVEQAVVTVRWPDGRVEHGFAAEIQGPSRLCYRPEAPETEPAVALETSAGVWLETRPRPRPA